MSLIRFQRPNLRSWSHFDHLSTIRDEINRLFETPQNQSGSEVFNTWSPALDLHEQKDNLVLSVELPGVKKEEIDISVHDNVVSVSGQREGTKNETGQTSRQERSFGRFTRSLKLPKPVNASQVRASYKDGVLTVTLPKAEEAKPRQVEIKD